MESQLAPICLYPLTVTDEDKERADRQCQQLTDACQRGFLSPAEATHPSVEQVAEDRWFDLLKDAFTSLAGDNDVLDDAEVLRAGQAVEEFLCWPLFGGYHGYLAAPPEARQHALLLLRAQRAAEKASQLREITQAMRSVRRCLPSRTGAF